MRSVLAALLVLSPLTVLADHELDSRDTAAGAATYAEHCASCHGADLEGQPNWQRPGPDGKLPAPPHDETGHTWHHDNGLLFDYTKFGGAAALAERGLSDFKSGMPAFADALTDDQILDVLAYIRSTWPTRIQNLHTARNPRH